MIHHNLKGGGVCLFALTLLSLSGCQSHNLVMRAIPYQHEAFGAANEGVRLAIIAPDKEAEAFSSAAMKALQSLDYSVVKPTLDSSALLPQGKPICTDAVPLAPSLIENHNRQFVGEPLLANANYRLSYVLQYTVENRSTMEQKHFALKVWSHLERRGAGGEWHKYPKTYSGGYFANRLCQTIETELKTAGTP